MHVFFPFFFALNISVGQVLMNEASTQLRECDSFLSCTTADGGVGGGGAG